MPIVPFLPAIGSAVGTISGIFNNKKNREETKQQNADDRNFQREMWDKTNAYNSPLEQMNRLKAGGLNPNLVYGNGATTTASNVTPTSSKPMPMPNSGEVMNSFFSSIVDLLQKNAQKDVMASQIALNAQDLKNKGITEDNLNLDFQKKNEDIIRSRRENSLGSELYQNTMDGQKFATKAKELENKEKEIKLAFAQESQQLAVYEAYARLRTASANMAQTEVETMLKREALNLRKKGIETSDNALVRIFSDLFPDKKDNKVNQILKSVNYE